MRVSKSLQTDPTDNELRKRLIEWFLFVREISRHIEDWDWAVRGYARRLEIANCFRIHRQSSANGYSRKGSTR